MNKKYEIQLQAEEHKWIEQLLHSDSTSKGIRNRCLVLLLADESQGEIPTHTEIARRAGVSQVTVHNSSLYETFEPERALALAKRLEIHYTPKHGSWLNIAEIELSALTIQCLNRRIASIHELQGEVSAWERERNQTKKSVEWQFTTEQARGKLKHLYPQI